MLNNIRYISVLEQIVYSGSSFLVYLIIARYYSEVDYGIWSIAISVSIFYMGFVNALIYLPLSVYKKLRYYGVYGLFLLVLYFFYIVLLFFLDHILAYNYYLFSISAAMGLYVYVYELVKKISYIKRNPGRFIAISLLISTVLVVGVYCFSSMRMSILSVCIVYILCSFVLLVYLVCDLKSDLLFGDKQIIELLFKKTIKFSFWSLLSHLVYSGYNSLIFLFIGVCFGPIGVANVAAMQNLVKPIQLLSRAVDNYDKIYATHVQGVNDKKKLFLHIVTNYIPLVIVAIILFAIFYLWFGEIIVFVYHGKYMNLKSLYLLWGGVVLLILFCQPIETFFYVTRAPRTIFFSRFLALLASSAVIGCVLICNLALQYMLIAMMAGWFVSFLSNLFFLIKCLCRKNECKAIML